MMDEKEILSRSVETILEEPAELKVAVKPGYYKDKSIRSVTFKIYPASLGTLAKLSREVLNMSEDRPDENILRWGLEMADKFADKVPYILALAIHNNKGEPPQELLDFLTYNIDATDYSVIIQLVFEKLHIVDFMNSIALTRRINILKKEASPVEQKETIASGELLAPLVSIFAGAKQM